MRVGKIQGTSSATSTQPNITFSWVRHEDDFAYPMLPFGLVFFGLGSGSGLFWRNLSGNGPDLNKKFIFN